jgi:hypothetical protein
LTDDPARDYVLSRFPNLKTLSLIYTGEDVLLLDNLMQRMMMTRLEELYWGCDTVILFSGNAATETKFHSSGK